MRLIKLKYIIVVIFRFISITYIIIYAVASALMRLDPSIRN